MNIKKPILLDGAMGTELINRGVEIPLPVWSANANLFHSEIVKDIHRDYILSGADVITTNTFRTTTWTYKKTGSSLKDSRDLARNSLYKAVECAHQVKESNVKIAGSITSIDDCYHPEKFPGRHIADDIYGETLEWIIDAGVDFVIFETMGNYEEIKSAFSLGKSYDMGFWISIIMKDHDTILDGTNINDVFSLLKLYSVECLLTNCNQMNTTLRTCEKFRNHWEGQWGAYPNLGITEYENDYFEIIDEPNFIDGIKSILMKDPYVIGICCGSNPQHIGQLNKLIKLEE